MFIALLKMIHLPFFHVPFPYGSFILHPALLSYFEILIIFLDALNHFGVNLFLCECFPCRNSSHALYLFMLNEKKFNSYPFNSIEFCIKEKQVKTLGSSKGIDQYTTETSKRL